MGQLAALNSYLSFWSLHEDSSFTPNTERYKNIHTAEHYYPESCLLKWLTLSLSVSVSWGQTSSSDSFKMTLTKLNNHLKGIFLQGNLENDMKMRKRKEGHVDNQYCFCTSVLVQISHLSRSLFMQNLRVYLICSALKKFLKEDLLMQHIHFRQCHIFFYIYISIYIFQKIHQQFHVLSDMEQSTSHWIKMSPRTLPIRVNYLSDSVNGIFQDEF